ncbi:indole-3-glycerol phosphate synthase TrpC [Radiobacillus kanasensis]|uniref:indole-3-glycerol phosphate synthase TrpC n=1 Tax=Radiobacillus kanasensis TaxID=2844358 RepID=UPI001E571317|nr:indole-3-glycerol phosphate synthase TrpC [Radiobacillus kanasensis]UFT99067.1 indole-3-glycerol phosphate synthase TrpC [Radiobacillus kanasensis]
MTILDKILAEKEKEVEELKRSYHSEGKSEIKQPTSLYQTFMHSEHMNIIAEIKRASPSKGVINDQMDPVIQGKEYESSGAGAISVLTDTPFFQGTMGDLLAVRKAVQLPLLNKDFIIDEIQIDRAHDYGANVILLIAAALPKKRVEELFYYATNKGLEVLMEVHDLEELEVANDLEVPIIGVNNRNLKTFEVDLGITERLAQHIKRSDALLISESGMKTTADVERVQKAGARAILVGETMMRSGNLAQTFEELRIPFNREQTS